MPKNRYDTEGKERAEMDELRMIVSCIEYYSYAKNIPGHKVFEAFDKNGVIQLLQDTRNQFPEMDTSFYLSLIHI